jgi:hypothetical protein
MADSSLVRQAVQAALAGQKTQPTETGDRAPDELGVVTGWRAWRVHRTPDEDGQVLLRSATWDYAWVPYEKARASCDRCTSEDPRSRECTPGEACSCGFYCARSLNHLRSMGYHTYNADSDGDVTIVGRVANWGKVIPGTQGWRAEYAYPERLFVPFEVARNLALPVSNTYGVPVTLMNVLDPDSKPTSRLRSLARVLQPMEREPKFLEAHRMAGFEDLDDDVFDDDETEEDE